VTWTYVRWVGGWTLALIAALALAVIVTNKAAEYRAAKDGASQEDPVGTHCHVYLFSGGANLGQWEVDRVRWNVNRDAVRFEADGFDYQISGDIVVECGHVDGVS